VDGGGLRHPPAFLAGPVVRRAHDERLGLLSRQHEPAGQLRHVERRTVLVHGREALDEVHWRRREQFLDRLGPEQLGGSAVREHQAPRPVLNRDGLAQVLEDRLQLLLDRHELLGQAGVVERQRNAACEHAQERRVVGTAAAFGNRQCPDLEAARAEGCLDRLGRIDRLAATQADADRLTRRLRVDRDEVRVARHQHLGHARDRLLERGAGHGQVGDGGEHLQPGKFSGDLVAQAPGTQRQERTEEGDKQPRPVAGVTEVVVPDPADAGERKGDDRRNHSRPEATEDAGDDRAERI
jgi:hypothetical protein